jgi:hypothetical protein
MGRVKTAESKKYVAGITGCKAIRIIAAAQGHKRTIALRTIKTRGTRPPQQISRRWRSKRRIPGSQNQVVADACAESDVMAAIETIAKQEPLDLRSTGQPGAAVPPTF